MIISNFSLGQVMLAIDLSARSNNSNGSFFTGIIIETRGLLLNGLVVGLELVSFKPLKYSNE